MPLVNKTFDQLLDFTRTSAATFVGSNGLIQNTAASRNLLTFTQEFDNAAWSKGATTVTANAEVAPDGTSTADTLTANGVSASHAVAPPVVSAGFVRTFSIYLKANTNSFAQVYFDGDVAPFANFNLATGVVGTTGSNQTATITAVGDGWYRCTIYTSSLTATRPLVLIASSASAVRNETNTLATSIFIWGAQLEAAAAATAYTRNNGGVFPPRFDFDPVTLAAKGLLIEEQRTNLLLYSAQFDNASWAKLGATITANATASPDGTTTADSLVEDTSTGGHIAYQTASFVSGTTYTATVFAKAGTRTRLNMTNVGGALFEGYFDLSNGTIISTPAGTSTITPMGNGWYRCQMTATASSSTSSNVQFRLVSTGTTTSYTGDGTSGLFIWGAQLEAGAFATSYIPTVASQVTRTADQTSIVAPNFAPWYNQSEGTFVAEFDVFLASAAFNKPVFVPSDGTTSNRLALLINASSQPNLLVTSGGVAQATITNTAIASNTTVKTAIAYKASDFAIASGGAAPTTQASGTVPSSITRLDIGSQSAAATYLNGHIRSIRYYPTRLTNAQLQALTA